MELYYEGKNITDSVNITGAVARDASGGRSDSLTVTLDHASSWYRWGPKKDDQIEIIDRGYSTGNMYINTIAPEGDSYRIIATAAKSGARRRASASFEQKTLEELMILAAAECGMDYRIYGLEKRIFYPFLLREREGWAAFLDRVAAWEGGKLKTYSGRFTMISVEAAQKLPAAECIHITVKQPGITYHRKENEKISLLTVNTPFARVSATDANAEPGMDKVICSLPAKDAATAGRWARGLLLNHNRQAEQLEIASVFHPAWTAMGRVDVSGPTDASGKWLIDEVRHDLVNQTSRATMFRCIESVV